MIAATVNVDARFTPSIIGADAKLVNEVRTLPASTATDHDQLDNRDLPDQHPISSITGLQEEIDAKAGAETVTEHINDTNIHVTAAEKAEWANHLVTAVNASECLVFFNASDLV